MVRTSRRFVGNGQQRARAGEQLALEIGAQAVAHDRDVEPVGDAGELPDLLVVEELRLVDEDAMHGRVLVMLGDAGEEIVAVAEDLGLRLQADARGDQPDVALAVVAGDEQHRRMPRSR